jgi:cytochrome c-type biogenesis protein CcmH
LSATFLVIAGLLAALSLALLLRPLIARRADAGPSNVTAIALGCVLLIGGSGLYVGFSNHDWHPSPVAQTPAAQAAALAKELARNPDNLEGWLALGGKYMEIEQYPLAARAYQRADTVAKGRSAAALIGLAESLLVIDFEGIRGQSGRLFDRVIELEPRNLKGLFYGAIAAFSRGDAALGRERFERLLALDPPANIRAIIEKQLGAVEAESAGGAPPTAGVSPSAASAPSAGSAPPAPVDATARVSVRVTVSPQLRYQLTGQSALFVLARDPDQPGPPFAAKRLPVSLPAEITLTAADAMLEQRRIAAGQTLEVVARISLSGQPQSSSGDPFGQVRYHVGKDGTLDLVIDRLAP